MQAAPGQHNEASPAPDLAAVSISAPAAQKPETVQKFYNPVPVVVLLVPVRALDPADGVEKTGILAVRRAIPPKLGELAIPGGFLGYEDWRAGGLREVEEETGLALPKDTPIAVQQIESVENGKRLIIFGVCPEIPEAQLPPFAVNDEVSERVILFAPCSLAFPTHTQALETYFKRK